MDKENTTNQEDKKTNIKTDTQEKQPQKPQDNNQKNDDPTKYGDWQVNGRTIDF